MKEAFLLILSLIAGSCGYFITTFWMNPILRYLQIRHEVTSDLIFFANVISKENLNEVLLERHEKRRVSNRKHASEIAACFYRLPKWYQWFLGRRGENPINASNHLVGLSNSTTNDKAYPHIRGLKKSLCLADELDI